MTKQYDKHLKFPPSSLPNGCACTHLEELSEKGTEVGEADSGLFWGSDGGADVSSPCGSVCGGVKAAEGWAAWSSVAEACGVSGSGWSGESGGAVWGCVSVGGWSDCWVLWGSGCCCCCCCCCCSSSGRANSSWICGSSNTSSKFTVYNDRNTDKDITNQATEEGVAIKKKSWLWFGCRHELEDHSNRVWFWQSTLFIFYIRELILNWKTVKDWPTVNYNQGCKLTVYAFVEAIGLHYLNLFFKGTVHPKYKFCH